MGVGVFEEWDLLLKNKVSIIAQISIMTSRLSSDMLSSIDGIIFAKPAYTFDIHVQKHIDGTIGIAAKDPIPTYPQLVSTEKVKQLSDAERLISIFNSLSQDERTILLGKGKIISFEWYRRGKGK